MMQGKLNSFQKTMLQWNSMHPYNAVHVVRVPEALDLARLTRLLNQRREAWGLTRLALDLNRRRYRYAGGSVESEIRVVEGSDGSFPSLVSEIERQLNTPFDPGPSFDPFRFFVARGEESFALGLVYFHAVTDAEPVACLLRNVVEAYLGRAGAEAVGPLELYPGRPDWMRRCGGLLARRLVALPFLARELAHSCRPSYRDPDDMNVGFSFFSLPPWALGWLVEAGRSLGVTLNDLVLALLLRALSPLAARRVRSAKRRELSVGCIVNIRRDLGIAGGRVFGLFLGSFVVSHEVPPGVELGDLARDIGRQTARIKEQQRYLDTPLRLAFARGIMSLFSTERRQRFYQKHYPLWGGVTNMNLNQLWDQRTESKPVDYLRAVSTGPATPLVLSVTTVGQTVNVGLSYRSTVFSAPDIERVRAQIVDGLGHGEARR